MVAKIISGKSIRGILHYNENKVAAHEAHLMMASGFATDITGMNLEQKLHRFENLTMLNGKVKTNALHITLNFDNLDKLSDEQLQRIFERFYRAEGSRNRASGGSGLGLAICQNIVEAHGGRISASHSPSGGVCMTLSLPLSIPHGTRN